MESDIKPHVLIVDDNKDAADMLGELLSFEGYTTCAAYDGFMALDMAPSFAPQIVLLDLGMPGLSGYQVAPRLRGIKGVANAFIIALTAWGDAESRLRAVRAGFDLHLTKPAKLGELRAALEMAQQGRTHIVHSREAMAQSH